MNAKQSLDDFLKQAKENAPKPRTEGDSGPSIQVLNLAAKTRVGDVSFTNQGSINFVPITPIVGPNIMYAYDTLEFQVFNAEADYWRWMRCPMIDDFVTITEDQKNLIGEIRSLITKAEELGYDSEWLRTKNYAFIFGYVLGHISNDQDKVLVSKENRKMTLLMIPSKNIAGAVAKMIKSIKSLDNGSELYESLFSRATSRNMFLELSFVRGSGFGYEVSIGYKSIDMFTVSLLTQAEKESGNMINIPQEYIDLATTHFGVMTRKSGDAANDFNEDYYKTLHAGVKGEVMKTLDSIKQAESLQNTPPPPVDGDPNAKKTWTPPAMPTPGE